MIKNFEQFINEEEEFDYSDYVERFSSKEAGEELNQPWLYNDWKLPNGMDPDQLGKLVMRKNDIITGDRKGDVKRARKSITDLCDKLVSLNPKLKDIECKNDLQAFDILFGALSKYNYDDIKFFTETPPKKIIAYNHKYNQDNVDLQQGLKIDISWVMSPTTRKRMWTLVKKK